MRKYLLAGAAALAGILVGVAVLKAQIAPFFPLLSGGETVEAALPGAGTSGFISTGRLSSGASNVFFSAFPASFTVGQAAGAVATTNMLNGGLALINASNTAQTFTMPPTASLIDGVIIGFCNVTAAAWATNAVTIAGNTGQTLTNNNTLTTLGAGSCGRYIWNAAQATWYRVQ